MREYDVIVVGAGPAGSAAAKTAAQRGVKTLLLEEHPAIGLPQHCSGQMLGTRSGLSKTILSSMDPRVILCELKARRIYSPRGRTFDIPLEGKGSYLIDRALFDHQLASQAVEAGTEILLHTKVTGLISQGEEVTGVKTNRKKIPEIYGKIVIAADGIRSLNGGLPVWSGLSEKVKNVDSGINMLLSGVKGVQRDVIELHVGSFGFHGWIWLQRNDAFTCHVGFENVEAFEKCKQGNAVLSNMLKEAVISRMTAYGQQLTIFPTPLPRKVKSGIILAGAAANYNSFLLSFLSGCHAGEVAAAAVKAGDITEKTLSAYETLCKELDNPGWSREFGYQSFINLSEEEQEEIFEKMTQADYVNFDVYDNL